MKTVKYLCVPLLLLVGACGGSSGGETEKSELTDSAKNVRFLDLEDNCYPSSINDKSEVLLTCIKVSEIPDNPVPIDPAATDVAPTDLVETVIQPPLTDLYVLYKDGERKLLYSADSVTYSLGSYFGNDQTVPLSIYSTETIDGGATYFTTRSAILRDGEVTSFDLPTSISGMSSSGEYFTAFGFIDQSENYQPSIFRGNERITLASAPEGIEAFDPYWVNDNGVAVGSAAITSPGYGYSISQAYRATKDSFELISSPTRPELLGVYAASINNRGEIALALDSSESYVYPGTTESFPVTVAAKWTEDNGVKIIGLEGQKTVSYPYEINDQGLVYGSFSTLEGDTYHNFLHSDKAGFVDFYLFIQEKIGKSAFNIVDINNNNEVLFIYDRGDGSAGGAVIQLGSEF